MATYKQWLAAFFATPVGRVWCDNLEYDRATGNLPAKVLERFAEAMSAMLRVTGKPGSAIEFISRAIKSAPDGFYLQGSRKPIDPRSYCRVIDATSFYDYNFDYKRLGWEFDDQRALRLWLALESEAHKQFLIGEMKTRKDFFWALPRCALADLEARCHSDEVASEVRNMLGFSWILEGSYLLRIDIPDDRLKTAKMRGPTTLDAELTVPPFLVPFAPVYDPAGYGWTRHLVSLSYGAPEVVIEKLPFGPDYSVVRIGRVSQDPPIVDPIVFHAVLVRERGTTQKRAGPSQTKSVSKKKEVSGKKKKTIGTTAVKKRAAPR